MTGVRKALFLSLAERFLMIALGLASNVVLARLLTPEQIGIYSVSLAVIGVVQVLRDFGIGSFLIQEANLVDGHIQTAFGLSLLIGGTLFLGLFLGAPFVGAFYGNDAMVSTLRTTAVNFLILPFCTISLALLRREMRFQALLVVGLAAAVVGFVVTISLAVSGFGPNSMAVGAVATNIVTGLGAWLARGVRRFLLPSLTHWRAVMRFGAQTSAANVVTAIAMDISDLALGKLLGFGPVAMISRAQGLMNMFHRDVMGAIRNVAYPAFANTHREGGDLETRYIASVAAVTSVAWPFYAFAGTFATELIDLLFGSQWQAAAPLVPWFCAGGAAAATCNLLIPLLTACGHVDKATQIDLVMQPVRAVLTVLAVWWFHSMFAFAVMFALLSFLSVWVQYAVKGSVQQTLWSGMRHALTKSAAVTLACALPMLVTSILAPKTAGGVISVTWLGLTAAACAGFWVMAMFAFKHPTTGDPAVTSRLVWFGFLPRHPS